PPGARIRVLHLWFLALPERGDRPRGRAARRADTRARAAGGHRGHDARSRVAVPRAGHRSPPERRGPGRPTGRGGTVARTARRGGPAAADRAPRTHWRGLRRRVGAQALALLRSGIPLRLHRERRGAQAGAGRAVTRDDPGSTILARRSWPGPRRQAVSCPPYASRTQHLLLSQILGGSLRHRA